MIAEIGKLQELLDWYIAESETRKKYATQRLQELEKHHTWIQADKIKEMTDEELKNKFIEYYKNGSGFKQNLNQLNRDRIVRDISRFRDTLNYLLDESLDIKVRIAQVLEGSRRIDGFGRAIVTALLMDHDPEVYCLWNNKTEMGFEALGIVAYGKRDPIGLKFLGVLKAMRELINHRPEHNLSFLDIDLFLHTISAEKEGIKKRKEILGEEEDEGGEGDDDMEEPDKPSTGYWQIAPGDKARLWDDIRKESIAAVGYAPMAFDLTGKSKAELQRLFQETHPGCSDMRAKIQGTQLWNFVNLKPGDKFITNNGRTALLAVGIVKGGYKFMPERNEYKHAREVSYYKISDEGISIPAQYKGLFGKTITPLRKEDFEAMEALFHSEVRSAWIFQANPQLYDIKRAVRELSDISFSVRVHKEKLQPGDIAYLWQSGPEAGLIAVATVTTTPEFIEDNLSDRAYFLKEDALNYGEEWRVNLHIDRVLEEPISRSAFVEHPVLSKSTIIRAPQGTNFLLTQEEKGVIDRLLSGAKKEISPAYSVDDFIAETGFSRDTIENWAGRLRRKMHVIIQGPPGTGKTYVAERLARLMVSNTSGFWDLVQFHPSYAYEDFIQGIRPRLTKGAVTWELEDGRFLQFCSRARQLPDAPCVLIIDEINRAHLSRVFGELMYLMEYRAKEIKLASGGDLFKIPGNVFLIGTMNTADRSIALVDHALRRRFSFIRLSPDYEVLQKHLNARGWPGDSLVKALKEVNRAINDPNYELGISYFMKDADLMKLLPDIWTGEIEPYLEEYFYDQPGKVQPFRWNALVKGQLMGWSK